jgi:hypothetical protein
VQELYARAHESRPHMRVSRVRVNEARMEGGCSSISTKSHKLSCEQEIEGVTQGVAL